jgi:hypothetical protein
MTEEMIAELTSSAHSLDKLNLTTDQKLQILNAYMNGLRYNFIFYTICTGLCLVASLGVGNTYLKQKKPKTEPASPTDEPQVVEVPEAERTESEKAQAAR